MTDFLRDHFVLLWTQLAFWLGIVYARWVLYRDRIEATDD